MIPSSGLSAEKEQLLRNPTLGGALKAWPTKLLGPPLSPDAPLAGLHKARLRWPKSTSKMIADSRAWLLRHGYLPE